MNGIEQNKKTESGLYSFAAKTMAVIAFVLAATVTLLLGITFIYMCADGGFYGGYASAEEAFFSSGMCQNRLRNELWSIRLLLKDNANREYIDADVYFSVISTELGKLAAPEPNASVRVEISDLAGNELYAFGEVPQDYGASISDEFVLEIKIDGKPDIVAKARIEVYLAKPLADTGGKFARLYGYFGFLYRLRHIAPVCAALGAILSIVLFIYLMKVAGIRYGEEGVREGVLDRIPYDIFLIAVFVASVLLYLLYDIVAHFGFASTNVTSTVMLAVTVYAGIAAMALLLFLALAYTTVVRLKAKKLLKNTILWRLCAFAGKVAKKVWEWALAVFEMLPAVGKAALIVPGFLFFNLFFCLGFVESRKDGSGIGQFFAFIILAALNIGAFATLIRAAHELVQLRQGSGRLAEGDLEYRFDTTGFHGEAKNIADNFNRISEGLAKAVEARSKSERMKVELITNVSHDLKTPITSIINYVDLLKKEPMPTDSAQKYLDVLDRQAQRLRKLTSDLIEASKASTGNIDVKLEPTDICELVDQSAAEYADRLATVRLTPIIRMSKRPIYALADGKLLWRVIDNLLSNVCKYSMPGTRVYIDAAASGSMATVTVRNISSEQLGGIDPDELTERFVRGDSSRSGEGSGLGLSIAKSLTELQGGRLKIEIDGDMFKATITMPLASV